MVDYQEYTFIALIFFVSFSTFLLYFIARWVNTDARNAITLKLGLTIIDTLSEVEFISSNWDKDDRVFNYLRVWLISLFATILVNLLFLRVFMQGILSNQDFLELFLKYRVQFFVTLVAACIDLDCIFVLNSQIFNLHFTSINALDLMTTRKLEMAAGVSVLFENGPQLIISLLIWNISPDYFSNRAFLISFICIICDILYGISRICFWTAISKADLQKAASRQHLEKVQSSVFAEFSDGDIDTSSQGSIDELAQAIHTRDKPSRRVSVARTAGSISVANLPPEIIHKREKSSVTLSQHVTPSRSPAIHIQFSRVSSPARSASQSSRMIPTHTRSASRRSRATRSASGVRRIPMTRIKETSPPSLSGRSHSMNRSLYSPASPGSIIEPKSETTEEDIQRYRGDPVVFAVRRPDAKRRAHSNQSTRPFDPGRSVEPVTEMSRINRRATRIPRA